MNLKNYALIKNNNVINLIVLDSPNEDILNLFKEQHNADKIILADEKASIGGTHDGDKFWLPQPFMSWIKNQDLNEWESPVPYPSSNEENVPYYKWNEDILNWEEVPDILVSTVHNGNGEEIAE